MKLAVHNLTSPYHVKFDKQDQWLLQIARDLAPDTTDTPNIAGSITIRTDNAGFVHASGEVTAEAKLPCDRCGRSVRLPITGSIQATFRPPYHEHAPREMALSAEDLDVYFIEDGQIDLEILINDTLQCSLPSQILCYANDLEGCGGEESPSDLIYADEPLHKVESPFAMLKNLKKS